MSQSTTTSRSTSSEAHITHTGMIGLGAMGLQMAKHMATKGFQVSGYDISPAQITQAAAFSVTGLPSVAEVGKCSQVVVVMVQTDEQVEQVFFDSGLLDSLAPGSVVCISSSVSPVTCGHLADAAAKKDIGVLDTPVVLGQEAANNGTMTVFVGGEARWAEKAMPILQTFGKHVIHLGPIGSGQIAKTVNNLLLWSCMSANFEALSFAKKMGADIPRLISALEHSSGANWSLSRWGKSTGKWAEKDMDVALELAQEAKVAMPLSALVDQLIKSINQEKMRALMSSP
jgi:3-hydroxyisobutyrate dehydrogenase-like beta-hydroxyacid dehydrogenase